MAEQTSRPSRARGLKLIPCCGNPGAPVVAPLAGAWIETGRPNPDQFDVSVAPLAGAWIETEILHAMPGYSVVAPLAGAWIETSICSDSSEGQ